MSKATLLKLDLVVGFGCSSDLIFPSDFSDLCADDDPPDLLHYHNFVDIKENTTSGLSGDPLSTV